MSSFNDVINADKPVLVDFSAEWCGPCKMMAPILKEVKASLGDAVTVIKLDIDKNPAVARKFGIQSVPTLIAFRQGQVKWRQSGVVPANQIESILKKI